MLDHLTCTLDPLVLRSWFRLSRLQNLDRQLGFLTRSVLYKAKTKTTECKY